MRSPLSGLSGSFPQTTTKLLRNSLILTALLVLTYASWRETTQCVIKIEKGPYAMFQHLFSRQRPQVHAKETLSLAPSSPRSLVRWLLPVSLVAMVALFLWFIADSERLSAASMVLQASPPISVDGGNFGLAAVGGTQTYTHTVTSHNLLPQTVTLTATTYKGWTVSVSPASLVLNPGASAPQCSQ